MYQLHRYKHINPTEQQETENLSGFQINVACVLILLCFFAFWYTLQCLPLSISYLTNLKKAQMVVNLNFSYLKTAFKMDQIVMSPFHETNF